MAIELPAPVVDFLSFIGIHWPDLNEDHIRELGQHTDTLVAAIKDIDSRSTATIGQIGKAYQGASTQRLSQVWNELNSTYLDPVLELAGDLGSAAPPAADVVIGMKVAAIAQLVAMALEFIADQALAVVTFGLSEAALPAIEELGAQAIKFLEQQLEDLVLNMIIDAAMTPLLSQIEELVEGMAFGKSGGKQPPGASFHLDSSALSPLIDQMHGYGDELANAGQKFTSGVQALSFGEN